MNDFEKLRTILDNYSDRKKELDFETIVGIYLRNHIQDFNLIRLSNFIYLLNAQWLQKKIYDTYTNIYVARENAQYVCRYLKGEMYKDEESAKEHLGLQIKNIEETVKRLKDEK